MGRNQITSRRRRSDLAKRFKREVVIMGSLHHKNIITIYGGGEEAGIPHLIMELLDGLTLADMVNERRSISLLAKVQIISQVAEGLAYAHSKGIVHRAIKPSNIMLQADGTVKIMDFGIALAPRTDITAGTMAGLMVGTPAYIAPEQSPSLLSKANQQTDIFAFGILYYKLLTGQHPFVQYGDIDKVADASPGSGDWDIHQAAEFSNRAGFRVVEDDQPAEFGAAPAPARCGEAALYAGWWPRTESHCLRQFSRSALKSLYGSENDAGSNSDSSSRFVSQYAGGFVGGGRATFGTLTDSAPFVLSSATPTSKLPVGRSQQATPPNCRIMAKRAIRKDYARNN